MTGAPEASRTAGPRVLLIGNYAADDQHSMRLYARTLADNLRALGLTVGEIEPPTLAARLAGRSRRAAKIAGYVDKYLIFPAMLSLRARRYDCVHIADHSNAPYRLWAAGRPVVVTCHDLFAVQIMLGEHPGQAFGRSGRTLQRWVASSLRKVRHFACVSASSATDLARLVGNDARIRVIPNALSPVFAPIDRAQSGDALASLGLDPDAPYVLHVGGNQFYKNRPDIVRLFATLAGTAPFADHRLVLAGKAPDTALAEAIAASPVRDRIDVLVGPSDAGVRALYARATALLFLSLTEGFGWPILEAQACGCPVVTSDAEPMRSVAGGAALLVDPADPAAAQAIAAGAQRFAALREAGVANAALYAPHHVYPLYLDLYDEAMREARNG